MKYSFLLLLLLSACLNATKHELYYKAYNEIGFKTTIQEIERGVNYSILEVDIIESDAQGSFTIATAAVEIGTELKKSHFALIDEYEKENIVYYKIFFTSDTTEDLSMVLPHDVNKKKLKRLNETDYASIDEFKVLFELKTN